MIISLVGNQNCGKTTLFNTLTGSNQHTGNFPGITVEQKIGIIKNTNNYSLVDLPGIYSMRPHSSEEIITRNFILNQKPNAIINIIDATNLERNLYLTLQLLELNIPMIIALNMMDEVKKNGGQINIEVLSKELKVPVIPISAIKNQGISNLIHNIIKITSSTPPLNNNIYLSTPAIHKCIRSISQIINQPANKLEISPTFLSTKIIEDDTAISNKLKLAKPELNLIKHSISQLELETKSDRNLALASARYNIIEKICKKSIISPKESKEHKCSSIIDKLLTNKYLGLPIFFTIMFLIFWLTFNVTGNTLSKQLSSCINYLIALIDNILIMARINPILHSLIIDGIFAGVGSILSFLPIIIVLFFFLSVLEDTGYMSRVTFILDKLLMKLGLSGKSFVPMLLGFGCSVPAVMATRTLSSNHDRKITLLLIPYMSCSAKLPIYAMFCTTFFPKHAPLIMIFLYITGITISIIIALLLRNCKLHKNSDTFIMELPNYRIPSLKNTFILMWNKAKDFIEKAFSVIFLASIIIWFLQTFDKNLNIVSNASTSLLAQISKFLTPIFTPLGLGNWKIISSLISGLSAKETVISTLNILLNTGTSELNYTLHTLFTPLTALSFLIFTLLYPPCIATLVTITKELKSPIHSILIILSQLIIAWFTAFIFFNVGKIIV